MQQQHPRLYNWQVWPAKNIPLCRGHCLFGPDLGVWLCNISITIVCSVLFFVYVAIHIHPAIIVFGILLDILALGSLMFATFTEPGIIPRQYHPIGAPRPPPQTQLVNGVQIPLKYCDTCHIYRPPRTKHCRDCDNCIEEFDHHCPWVCNCVGRRNYRYFVSFVWSVCLLDLYVFFNCGYFLIHEGVSTNFSDAVSLNPIPTALTAVTLMLGCCLGSLAGYHCGLIAEQMTTNEHIKRSRINSSEQHDDDLQQQHISYCDALKKTFCIPIPESRIQLREFALPIPTSVSTGRNDSTIHTTIPPESHAIAAPIAQPLMDDEIRETSRDRMMHDELHHVV